VRLPALDTDAVALAGRLPRSTPTS